MPELLVVDKKDIDAVAKAKNAETKIPGIEVCTAPVIRVQGA